MKTEKVPWNVGRDEVVVGVGSVCGRRERGVAKTCFSAGYTRYTVYVSSFKNIRQGALQFYCVRFFSSSVGPGSGVGMRLS